jgi:hypothetical protein
MTSKDAAIKSSKRAVRKLIKAALDTLNAAGIEEKFVCHACKNIILWEEPYELATAKDGCDLKLFCEACTQQCEYCSGLFAPTLLMESYHYEFCQAHLDESAAATTSSSEEKEEAPPVKKKSKKQSK